MSNLTLNEIAIKDRRNLIKENLEKSPESWQNMFNRMYGSVETIPEEKMSWALTQIQNSLNELKKKEK